MMPCEEAANSWKTEQLFLDLEEVRRELTSNKKGIEQWHKEYLCLLLTGHTPRKIAQEYLYMTIESLRVKLSAKGGLYDCIRKLTSSEITDWRDVIILLLNQGYRKSESKPSEREETIIIVTCDVDISEPLLRKVETTMKKITGSNNLKITRIESGSVVFVVEGDAEACRKLETSFHSGELEKLLGFPVHDVKIEPAVVPAPAPIRLGQWLQGIFEPVWQPMEWAMAPGLRSTASTVELERDLPPDSIVRARPIDLWTVERVVTLVIQLIPTQNDGADIRLQLHPNGDSIELPPNLQLSVLDETGSVCLETESRQADNWLQLAFSADPGERFSIRITLEQFCFLENFAL